MMKAAEKGKLLVVDDDAEVVDYLTEMLTQEGYHVTGTTSPQDALTRVVKTDFDLVISDVEMPQMRGIELIAAIQSKKSTQLVLFITAFGSIDLAVQSVRAGACDFIIKPFKIEVLVLAIERALRERRIRREIVRLRSHLPGSTNSELVAQSEKMKHVLEAAERAASTNLTVLITGESGVGKGALAKFIHQVSPRSQGPFIQINCAALPAPLVESELFGVRKGAYTDAQEDRMGLFLKANSGTLFLDEIAEMAIESQPKLLRVLESGNVRPVGENHEVVTDVRVIVATNRPLEEAIREGKLRADLYYRLNVIRLEIPPLRERLDDLEALADVFLHRASVKVDRSIIAISSAAMLWLKSHPWPGNVRELENTIERAVALTDHDTIVVDDLTLAAETTAVSSDFLKHAAAQHLPLADIEHAYIQRVMEITGGNKALAARILDIDRRTLHRKLEVEEADESSRTPKDK